MPKLTKQERESFKRYPTADGKGIIIEGPWLTTDFTEQSERDAKAFGIRMARRMKAHYEAIIFYF